SYMSYLDKDGLQGARIGVLRELSDTESADPEVKALFEKALHDLQRLGATIVDPFVIPDFMEHYKGVWCDMFRHDINEYFASHAYKTPVRTIREVYESGQYSEYIKERLENALAVEGGPEDRDPPCLDVNNDPKRIAFREEVLQAMDGARVDAVVYPSWSNPPRKIGDSESPHGNNSPYIPPHTGQPALTAPMGYTYGNLPAGLQFLGRPFDEPNLIKFAYAYEQGTKHRKPPEKFPALD
ncbi:amidase, partial [bacterium]|nr:amidase [bacterium]